MTDPRTPAGDDPQARALLRSVRRMEQLYAEFHGQAMARAVAMLGDRQLAEDAVHQAFVQIIVPVFAGRTEIIEEDPRGAVLRSTRWAALNILRRRRRRRETEQVAGMLANGGDEAWVRVEARILCESMLAELPEHYRAVLHCRYVEQDSDRAGAARLGITVKAYQRRLQRAVAAARRAGLPRGIASVGALLQVVRRRPAPARRTERRIAPRAPLWRLVAVRLGVVVAAGGALAAPQALPAPPATATMTVSTTAAALSAAWSETPEDTLIYSAATTGDGRAVVAVGLGDRCRCPVLLRTTDGGSTWRSAPGPERATELALPPAYPADPRIFVAGGATADLESPAFGEPFGPLGPRLGAGLLALDPAFDAGQPRVWLAGNDRVLRSVDLRSGLAHEVWVSTQSFTAILATRGGGVLAATAPRGDTSPSLVACTAALRCTAQPLPPGGGVTALLPAGSGTGAVAVRHHSLLLLAGTATMPPAVPLPAEATEVLSAALPAGAAAPLWITAGGGGAVVVLRLDGPAGTWSMAGQAGTTRATVVALTGRRALLLLAGAGLRCTADGGATWWPRCPS